MIYLVVILTFYTIINTCAIWWLVDRIWVLEDKTEILEKGKCDGSDV